jgi:hypothetical protein
MDFAVASGMTKSGSLLVGGRGGEREEISQRRVLSARGFEISKRRQVRRVVEVVSEPANLEQIRVACRIDGAGEYRRHSRK